MKAEELFKKYAANLMVERYFDKRATITKAVLEERFAQALTEYRDSIISQIDEMIKNNSPCSFDHYSQGYVESLIELKNKITCNITL